MNRAIRKSRNNSANEAAELLAGLFAAELCAPSKCLWLVSPWVSDVELIDNSAGSFDALTRFGKRPIRLTEILVALASSGVCVVVGTTSDTHNLRFIKRLRMHADDMRVSRLITVVVDESEELHTKALTGDDFALGGSMNITFNGIQVREESVDLRTDEAYVAQARMDAFDRFGGVL
ncbi:MAG: phospholipase D-like domain-containing protein DpdK [Rhodococcus sp.]|nr:phospholipase D-like domain-containing protein DpdK [Rhodococcus qingshengii]MCW0190506.1 phospholipase D-like domain-containing protein DpdK [Rhodococcus sp. (in: high G+C Gram-positive bacteria)]